MFHLLPLCLLALVYSSFGQQSPCDKGGHRTIPNEGLRYVQFTITREKTPFHDSRLTKGWYYVGKERMPEYAPALFSCGTFYPIWLDGKHPEDDTPVNATACVKDLAENCTKTFNIKIMRCPGMFFLYYLPPTDNAQQGYCFGERTAYVPPVPSVAASIIETRLEGFLVSQTIFECLFEESTTEDLYYQVFWLRDGSAEYITSSENSSGLANLRLTEALFVDKGFRLGQYIGCAVRAYAVIHGVSGQLSAPSDDLFAGIKILTPSLTFTRGETNPAPRTIRIQPTVPIGCRFNNNCDIWLTAYTPPESTVGKCNGLILDRSRCGTIIQSEKYSAVYEIVVGTSDTGQYQTSDEVYNIFLQTDAISDNLIWKHYRLPPVKVTVLKPNDNRGHENKRCKAYSDPHMVTFDQSKYDNHWDGVFIMYKHTEFDAEIFLPYGTYIDVRIRRGMTLELDVIPSSNDDEEKARGLCGLMGGGKRNDFHDRNGVSDGLEDASKSKLKDQPKKFISTWQVKANSANMFHNDFNFASIESWPFHVCVCENSTNDNAGIDENIPCNKNAVATCTMGKTVGKHTCKSPARSRRSVRGEPKIPTIRVQSNGKDNLRVKRAQPAQKWTEKEAREFCEHYMSQSPVYSLCSDVPSVTPYESIDICVVDIQISQGTDWAAISMDNMQEGCISELSRNLTLRETEDDTPSIAEQIESLSCPSNCSSSGICVEGKCQCDKGLGGADCSMDMSKGPVIAGLLDDGLCDEQTLPCDHVYVFGGIFIDSTNLTCRLHEFTVDIYGQRIVHGFNDVPGEFETLIEVVCPIASVNKQHSVARRSTRTEQVFVHGYTVSVANNGVIFEKGKDLFVYDSECQTPTIVQEETHFSLTENFCFIEGTCRTQGTKHPTISCLICDSLKSTSAWSADIDSPECRNDGTDQPGNPDTTEAPGDNNKTGDSILSMIKSMIDAIFSELFG